MKNILILASGTIAKHFIDWVSKNRIGENLYHVMCYQPNSTPENINNHIALIKADPTSFSKLNRIMGNTHYNNIFIVMEDIEEAKYALKNIGLINSKSRIVLVNQWDDSNIGKEYKNITILHSDKLIAIHLYDNLPNVPLIAQNVGLGQGEIMEIHVPFGSPYAFRHVGSIVQRKWRIVAIYREGKQMLSTRATMIKPNDSLLVIGKPLVLDGVYKSINKRLGLFPEPFGKDIYLILDMRYDHKNAVDYLKESIYLCEKLENKSLYVRILYPNDFSLKDKLREYESNNIMISVYYETKEIEKVIEFDINQYDIGLVLVSVKTFHTKKIRNTIYALKKLVYLFGEKKLSSIKKSLVLVSGNEKMESISATAFDISESLGLNLILGDFDPEGDFESKKMIIEHYETLTHIFNKEIRIEQKIANPVRELAKMKAILQIAPFENELNIDKFIKFTSTTIQDFLLITNEHPKLLVPFSRTELKDESC